MNPVALWRIFTSCTFRVQRELWRFAWNGFRAVRAFERRQKRLAPFFPAFLMLSVTNRCNLRCKGCWVKQTRIPQQLSLIQLQNIVNTAQKYGSRFFGILGGEPLFHSEIFTLFEKNPNAYFQLYTNGTMLDMSIAARLAKCGNVTPLISIEGLELESKKRRGRDDVFERSFAGLDAVVKAGLFTGVTASINQRNFTELVCKEYLNKLIAHGVHYIWYFIYRPCGDDPDYNVALNEEQIIALRRFIVDERRRAKIIILDAYWDADGNAVCPGAMGISHHIAPNGAVEFCPVIQATGAFLNENADNLESIFQENPLMEKLRNFSAEMGRSCVLMESPRELGNFLTENGAIDSSNRAFLRELSSRLELVCHDIKGREIAETSWAYRFAKKYCFFGFGAYG